MWSAAVVSSLSLQRGLSDLLEDKEEGRKLKDIRTSREDAISKAPGPSRGLILRIGEDGLEESLQIQVNQPCSA